MTKSERKPSVELFVEVDKLEVCNHQFLVLNINIVVATIDGVLYIHRYSMYMIPNVDIIIM